MRFLLSSLFTLGLCGCVTPVKFDSEKIRPWSEKLDDQAPFQNPYVADFQRGVYRLRYVAAHHQNELNSPTLKLVSSVMEKSADVKVLLIEPISYVEGKSPQFYIDYAKKSNRDKFIEGGESAWAVLLAQDKNLPFFGGEPRDEDIAKAIFQNGYKEIDLVGFYLVRQIPQWRREGKLKKKTLMASSIPYLSNVCKRLDVKQCPSFQEVKEWYLLKMKTSLTENVDGQSVAPDLASSIYTQRISGEIGKVRDAYTLSIIERLLQEYKSVIVVYGASHFMTLRLALESFLGKPHFYTDSK